MRVRWARTCGPARHKAMTTRRKPWANAPTAEQAPVRCHRGGADWRGTGAHTTESDDPTEFQYNSWIDPRLLDILRLAEEKLLDAHIDAEKHQQHPNDQSAPQQDPVCGIKTPGVLVNLSANSLGGRNARFVPVFADKVIHDLLLGHPLVDHLADLILPLKAASHIAILEDERTLAGAGEILHNFVNRQRRRAGRDRDMARSE